MVVHIKTNNFLYRKSGLFVIYFFIEKYRVHSNLNTTIDPTFNL